MSLKITSLFLSTILVIFNVLQSVIAQVMASEQHDFAFHLSAVVHLTECLKLAIAMMSALAYFRTNHAQDPRIKLTPSRRTILVMAVPAGLYTASNTLTYHSIALMGSSNFQIWGNLRIAITAVLCRLFTPRPILVIQWLAVILLVMGSMAPSFGACDSTDANFAISATSILCILAQTTCTSLAGVYQELLFKSTDQHFTVKNVCLYSWTCLLTALKLQSDLEHSEDGMFTGFSHFTWLSIVVYACYGQVVSLTLAYCDNLVKVFATSFGATVALLVDALLLGRTVQLVQVSGAAIVVISTTLFYLDSCILMKSI
jgi:drug/metabolite transporter (DMT)-like permease